MLVNRQGGTGSASSAKPRQQEANAILASILADMLGRSESQDVILAIADQVVSNWAGTGRWKQGLGKILLRMLPGILEKAGGTSGDGDVAGLLGRHLTLKWTAANETAGDFSEAEPAEAVARTRQTLDRFLENIDLGELDERLLKSQAVTAAKAGGIADVMTTHFGKLGTLAPIGVTLTNTVIQILDHLMEPAVNLPPDMVAGLLANMILQIDDEALVRVLNKKNELTRMIHIGSLLEGDGTISGLEAALHEKLSSGMKKIDSEAYFKMQAGKIANTSAVDSARLNALKEAPELVRKQIALAPRIQNEKIRMALKKLDLLENLDKEECTADVTGALNKIDAGALAELINQTLELFQDIRERRPDILTGFLAQVAADIDTDLLENCSRSIIEDVVKVLGPVLSGVTPVILKGVFDLLKPSGEADSVSDVLQHFLSTSE